MPRPAHLPPLLELERVGDHRYAGRPEHSGEQRNVVFGGQILAQMIMAAHLDRSVDTPDDMEVKSIHAVFARAGDYSAPIEYEVDSMHAGRTLGSDTVTFAQHGRIMSRRSAPLEPRRTRPHPAHRQRVDARRSRRPTIRAGARTGGCSRARWASSSTGSTPGATTNRCAIAVQTRLDPLRRARRHDPVVHQAVLSWATDGFLIGTAMLPHAGYNESHAHRTISTGVVSHTVNFHERFDASEWLLLAHESIWAGRGRTHGRCNVWT